MTTKLDPVDQQAAASKIPDISLLPLSDLPPIMSDLATFRWLWGRPVADVPLPSVTKFSSSI